MEPEKPFACPVPECGMTFTNEDHLHVHTKKHDMVLQLGAEQRAAFVADQTPTPTRFIRNCEEVGLFQDLQNVNPFDEGFKRAMENKQGLLSMEATTPASASSDDVLHTPQNVFPLLATGETFSTMNKNVTISRSSSDESGTIKEYETTTISKLTNEVTTISRLVGNREMVDKNIVDDTPVAVAKNSELHQNKDIETVYKNKVIKIHNNIEIRKDAGGSVDKPVLIYTDSVIKDSSVVTKDVLLDELQVEKVPPIMSQKSLDFVVDSLTSDLHHTNVNVLDRDKHIHVNKANIVHSGNVNIQSDFDFNVKPRAIKRGVRKKVDAENAGDRIEMINDRVIVNNDERQSNEDYEVIIKLPNGKKVRMKTVEEYKPDTKEILRKSIEKKAKTKNVQAPFISPVVTNVLQIPGGTLIPVTLVNPIGAPLQTGIPSIPVTNNIVLPITQSLAKIPISIDPNARVKEKIVSKSRIRKNPVIINLTESDDESNDNIEELQSGANRPTLDVNDRLNGNVSSKVQSKSEEIVVRQNVPNDPRDIERYKLDCKSAASRRYRNRLKEAAASRRAEVRSLLDENRRLRARTLRLLALLQRHAPDVAMAESEAMAREQLKIGTDLEDEL